jgi:hypothetical protein
LPIIFPIFYDKISFCGTMRNEKECRREKVIIEVHDLIGFVGALCVLISYWLLQANKMSPTGFTYSGLNLAGAVMIMFSLVNSWNLTAFIIEIFWGLISLYGLLKWYYQSLQKKGNNLP